MFTNPDFVIEAPVEDPKSVEIRDFVKSLRDVGFETEVRPGYNKTQLVLVKGRLQNAVSPADRLQNLRGMIATEWPVVPLHDFEFNKKLIKSWRNISESDIDTLKDHFGVKIGLYFGFLKFYTHWLLIPSFIGVVCHLFLGRFSVLFTLFNLAWGIVFINWWKLKQREYITKWNVPPQPKRVDLTLLSRKLCFVPIALSFTAILVAFQFLCFFVEIFFTQIYNGPLKPIFGLVPTAMIVVFVAVLTAVYTIVIKKFVHWETGAERGSVYEISIAQKMFVITLLTSFVPLLITSFVYLPFASQGVASIVAHDQVSYILAYVATTDFELNAARLNTQFAYFVVTNQIVSTLTENVVPFVVTKVKALIFSKTNKAEVEKLYHADSRNEKQLLDDVRYQLSLPEYSVSEDYREMVCQFGYLTMFGSVWSLGHLVSFVNNILIEFRGDATHMMLESRRPMPETVDSISPWDDHLAVVTWLATLVAPAVTAMYRNGVTANFKTPYVVAFVLVAEHSLMGLNFLLNRAVEKSADTEITEKPYSAKFVAHNVEPTTVDTPVVPEIILEKSQTPETIESSVESIPVTSATGFERFASPEVPVAKPVPIATPVKKTDDVRYGTNPTSPTAGATLPPSFLNRLSQSEHSLPAELAEIVEAIKSDDDVVEAPEKVQKAIDEPAPVAEHTLDPRRTEPSLEIESRSRASSVVRSDAVSYDGSIASSHVNAAAAAAQFARDPDNNMSHAIEAAVPYSPERESSGEHKSRSRKRDLLKKTVKKLTK